MSRPPRRLRPARALAPALVVLGLLVPALQAAPAAADSGDRIVFQRDPVGDVQVLPDTGTGTPPGRGLRQSIDLLAANLVEQYGGVRVTVRLQRILTNARFDQLVEVQMKPGDSAQTWFLDVTMSGQDPAVSSASYSADLSGENTQFCGRLPTTVDADRATVSVIVPDACLPTSPAKVRVFSSLVSSDPDGGTGYALDRLRIRGAHLMHP